MKSPWRHLTLVVVLAGCVVSHITRPVPPPGGCDVCHRVPIRGGWRLALTPVQLEQGAPVADRTLVSNVEARFQTLSKLPVHEEVPGGRLKIFAAGIDAGDLDSKGMGTRCFACHLAPDAVHVPLRGTFPHPVLLPSP